MDHLQKGKRYPYLKDEFIFTKLDSVLLSDLVILGNIWKKLSILKELGEKCKTNQIEGK